MAVQKTCERPSQPDNVLLVIWTTFNITYQYSPHVALNGNSYALGTRLQSIQVGPGRDTDKDLVN